MPPEQIDLERSICGCKLGNIGVKFVLDLAANSRLVEESFRECPLARDSCKVRLIGQILLFPIVVAGDLYLRDIGF